MSQNPTPEACRAVANQIRKAIEEYPNMKLDMHEGRVKSLDHACGTTHCHAGIFLLGEDNFQMHEINGFWDYTQGIQLMTERLGFAHKDDLRDWAKNNPELWGNENGYWMFSEVDAFNYAKSVSEIADWWSDVADRIEEYNKSQTN